MGWFGMHCDDDDDDDDEGDEMTMTTQIEKKLTNPVAIW
jgi:hypothetical protein